MPSGARFRLQTMLIAVALIVFVLFATAASAQKRIAISFDDVPRHAGGFFTPDERTHELIAALKRAGVKQAGFFVTTGNLDKPDGEGGEVRIGAYVAAGHVLGNHSTTHPWLSRTDVEAYLADIDGAEAWLANRPGRRGWFRYPYLDEGRRDLEKRDAIRRGLDERGLLNAYVTVDNYDWHMDSLASRARKEGTPMSMDGLRDLYVETLLQASNFYEDIAVKALGRSPIHVILLHETDLAALFIEDFVAALRADGWDIATLDEAYADPMASSEPDTWFLGSGRVAALAHLQGWEPRDLVHERTDEEVLNGLFVARVLEPANNQKRQAESDDLTSRFNEGVESRRSELIAFRRDLHRNPETSGNEERTSQAVARELERLGLTVTTGVGGHGVVAILEGAQPGPTVAFRADMDAVPSSAPDPVEFRSEIPGVRHICGHDIHTTIGLALAEGFVAIRESLAGSVMFVFQPAEESATGARAMLADGALDQRKPDAIYAVHTAPMPVGHLITAPGTLMAWRDRVEVTVTGSDDLKTVADGIRTAIDGVGTISPAQAGAPASGDFRFVQSRTPTQIASDGWTVSASISVATADASNEAKRRIEDYLGSIEREGLHTSLTYEHKWIAGVTNEPALTEAAIKSAQRALTEPGVSVTDNVIPMFSEDFGSFQQVVPGVMFFLGVSNAEKGWVGMPHTPDYVADEEAIFVGARTMGAVLLDFLRASH